MRKLTRTLARMALAATLALPAVAPQPGQAQGLFAPAIFVDDQAITGYELQQRAEMLRLLNAPGNLDTLAREQLIDDRLRLQAASDAGIQPSEEEILDGMEEFAGRAELSREDFVRILEGNGVAEQTFREFVRAGLAWRQLVQQRFAGRISVSESEVDRALASQGSGSAVRVLLSEIIMPAPPPQLEAVRARANEIAGYTTEAQFSAAARQYSATPSRGNGGRLPWQNLTDLPPGLQPILLGLRPGEVTDPLPIQGAIALFQLRDIEEGAYASPEVAALDYAIYYLPGGRSEETLARARVLSGRLDRCDDLYGVAKGQPPEVLSRETRAPAEIPTEIAYELSKLDEGEVSTALTTADGGSLMLLMLCGRSTALGEDVDREQFTMGLRNQRITAAADGYLAQLRADARIVEK